MLCLITGASRGIGKSTALQLAQQGWYLILIARDETQLINVQKECVRWGAPQVEVLMIDVSDAVSLQSGIAQAVTRMGKPLDAVVIAAGVERVSSAGSRDLEQIRRDWQLQIAINVQAVLDTTLFCVPYLNPQRSQVVILSSIAAGHNPVAGLAAYQASKAAVRSFADGLHMDLCYRNVRVSSLSSDLVDTDMGSSLAGQLPEIFDHDAVQSKLIRPHDVSQTIAFLCNWKGEANLTELVLQPTTQLNPDFIKHWDGTWQRTLKKMASAPPPLDVLRESKTANKTAFITGGSQGIGLAIALCLAQQGYGLALVARTHATLSQAAAACRAAGSPHVVIYSIDVADHAGLKSAFYEAVKTLGGMNVVVSGAGTNRRINSVGADLQHLEHLLRVNLYASMVLCTEAAKVMHALSKEQGQSSAFSIIMLGSWTSCYPWTAHPGMAGYWASKWGLQGFANGLTEDVKTLGIKVCLLQLGFVDNDLGNAKGPIDFEKEGFIKNEDVAQVVQHVIDAPPSVNISHIYMKPSKESIPSVAKLAKRLDYQFFKSKL